MKVLITYPPIESEKGTPLLSQNRQFQYFNNPTFIFPVIPASAATLLKSKGYNVLWKDAIVENLSKEHYSLYLQSEKPDLIALETKTPVIKKHWQIINEIKTILPKTKIVLFGDHVTVFPEESFKNSKVDFIITGGDYDFSLLSLVNHLNKKTKLESGIYYKERGKIKNSGKFKLTHNIDNLPFIDRELTKFNLYQKEFNIPIRPYAYIMSARDCWHAQCSFCAWPTLYPKFRTRSVNNILDEIGMLITKYNVKEIFDDSGTFPVGNWLKEFCEGMISRGYNKKIKISCNMRFNALNEEEYKLMKKAGFRLLKFGLESANQETLDKINKKIKVEDIISGCKLAKKAKLTVHLTMIIGWPWETKQKALKTLELTKKLMTSGLADVLQATILIPYPGTQLYGEGLRNKWFLFNPKDYERYDMSEVVFKTPDMKPEEVMNICNNIYKKVFFSPKYILRHLTKIRNKNDIKYTIKGIKAVLGHIKDFSRK